MASPRDPITTHVLDSTTGRPAPLLMVTLMLLKGGEIYQGAAFSAKTSETDGRIDIWEAISGTANLQQLFESHALENMEMVWILTFDTEDYWGEGRTFYPHVQIMFSVKPGDSHYHVPLLLGPWGYTTYRGS